MGLTIYQVDAFTKTPFKGNPAGVCLLPAPAEASWMQDVAREMNLSETAFLVNRNEGFDLRWFTPAVEVDLCGHATLASAHILWESGVLPSHEEALFHTRSGLLKARLQGELIQLDFPSTPEEPAEAPPALLRALGVEATYVGKSAFDFLVEVRTEETVRNLNPDFGLLGTLPMRGVIVTSLSDSADYDFLSRFFAPAAGVNEDPVTGSAHCCLTPFWSRRLGREDFTAYQASERGGMLYLRLVGDRVLIGGHAVTVMRADLLDFPERP